LVVGWLQHVALWLLEEKAHVPLAVKHVAFCCCTKKQMTLPYVGWLLHEKTHCPFLCCLLVVDMWDFANLA
jgi:hypothetical protein